jgi:hypothetical protein
MTAAQLSPSSETGVIRSRLGYAAAGPLLLAILEDLGHEVEVRPVEPGERLSASRYDRVIVFVAPILIFGARHAYGALWALHARPDAWVAVDDWQVGYTANSYKTAARDDCQRLWTALSANNRPQRRAQLAKAVVRGIDRVCVKLGDQRPWCRALAPLYTGARFDPTRFRWPYGALRGFDPSPYYRPPEIPRLAKRARRWVLAALSDHDRWLAGVAPTWPVDRYGRKSAGQTRVTEAELLARVYPAAWGIIAPPYWHAGSGWWRARYQHAIAAGSVVLCDPADAFAPGITLRDLERSRNLGEYAAAQADAFKAYTATRAQTRAVVHDIIQETY